MQSNNETKNIENASFRPSWFSVKLNTVWKTTKQVCSVVLTKIVNVVSAVRNHLYFDEYVYAEPVDDTRLYIANEVPYELEPVLDFLSQGDNGFVIEDDEGDTHSVIINVDMVNCAKVMVVLLGINSTALLVLLFTKMFAPGFYAHVGRKFIS